MDIIARLERRINQLELERDMYKSKYIKIKKVLSSMLKKNKKKDMKLKELLYNLNNITSDLATKLDRIDELYNIVFLLVSKINELENKIASLERRINLYEKRHI